jgi:hypothetical protein
MIKEIWGIGIKFLSGSVSKVVGFRFFFFDLREEYFIMPG